MENEKKVQVSVEWSNKRFSRCRQCFSRDDVYSDGFKCKIARLEKKVGHIPTQGEAIGEHIDLSGIPEKCPNGYINASRLSLRPTK